MPTPIDSAAVTAAANDEISSLRAQAVLIENENAILTDLAAKPLCQTTHEGVAALHEILQGDHANAQ